MYQRRISRIECMQPNFCDNQSLCYLFRRDNKDFHWLSIFTTFRARFEPHPLKNQWFWRRTNSEIFVYHRRISRIERMHSICVTNRSVCYIIIATGWQRFSLIFDFSYFSSSIPMGNTSKIRFRTEGAISSRWLHCHREYRLPCRLEICGGLWGKIKNNTFRVLN